MSIKVNEELCIGCGACVSLCPDVFKMNEAGKSEVINPASAEATAGKEENAACAKNAAESCPVQAIEVHPVK
ncbi:MAG: ferredoxin [Patescibacteria group bacterium]